MDLTHATGMFTRAAMRVAVVAQEVRGRVARVTPQQVLAGVIALLVVLFLVVLFTQPSAVGRGGR